jgi:Ala-tRNA(Pro) deacylase
MSLNLRVRQLLHQEDITYKILSHKEAFTSQEVAAESDISGWNLAKVVVLRSGNGAHRMVVLPAPAHLDLAHYREYVQDPSLELADETEIGHLFPDCEVGAMPPFGSLYGIPVHVDACLSRSRDFYFQAGNHHQVVRMRYEDFDRVVRPTVGGFCEAHRALLTV